MPPSRCRNVLVNKSMGPTRRPAFRPAAGLHNERCLTSGETLGYNPLPKIKTPFFETLSFYIFRIRLLTVLKTLPLTVRPTARPGPRPSVGRPITVVPLKRSQISVKGAREAPSGRQGHARPQRGHHHRPEGGCAAEPHHMRNPDRPAAASHGAADPALHRPAVEHCQCLADEGRPSPCQCHCRPLPSDDGQ